MYRHIMVPVDGSKLAECVLPHVAAIAQGCQITRVTFVRVVKPFHLYQGDEYSIIPEERERLEEAGRKVAREYLVKLTKPLHYGASEIGYEVLYGKESDQLTEFADKNGVDLIVISTHGRSGISQWIWGSVTDRVLRSSCVPVLMVRAPGCVPGVK
ncbi:MAG: universal stress protein [Chloroflexota bacterium]